MPDTDHQKPIELDDEPSAAAELKITKSSDKGLSLSAKLPEKNASDLLPLAGIVACLAGPPAIFLTTGAVMPWWASAPVGVLQLLAVLLIVRGRRE